MCVVLEICLMADSWTSVISSGISSSTRVQLVHDDYTAVKRRKGRLILGALTSNIVTILCSLGLLICVLLLIFRFIDSTIPVVVVGLCLVVFAYISAVVERRVRAEYESTSAKLLQLERRLWKSGLTDFTTEHVARHRQPLIHATSTVSIREPKSPSGADLVATEKLMQSFLDLIVAPFGSITQVRADPMSLTKDRKRIADVLGASQIDMDGQLQVGLLAPSTIEPVNCESNVAILTNARLWQEADQFRRVLVCGPTFRPEDFDPWHSDSLNRMVIYLPQLGAIPRPQMVASQAALLFSEREDVHDLSLFCHDENRAELEQALNRRGLVSQVRYLHESRRPETFGAARRWSQERFYRANGPSVESPLTFDVGLTIRSDVSDLMSSFFDETCNEVIEALGKVTEIKSIENYSYVAENHRIELGVTSWRTSQSNRQDLLWNIFRSFAAFYRPDGDWKRAGSPAISLMIDQTVSSRSGEFMEYLAVARHTRSLLRS